MRSTQIFATVATLASAASAGVIPRAEVDCNLATGYGCWTVSNVTETIPPSASHHIWSFVVQHDSQTTMTTCKGTSEEGITCDDSAYQASVDQATSTLTLHEKLYQTGAIAVLGGNATVDPPCTLTATNWICTTDPFKVPSVQVGAVYPNGTTEGYTF